MQGEGMNMHGFEKQGAEKGCFKDQAFFDKERLKRVFEFAEDCVVSWVPRNGCKLEQCALDLTSM